MSKSIKGFTHIGDCPVDSGQIMLIDPCYILQGDNLEKMVAASETDDDWYVNVCNATLTKQQGGQVLEGLGVATSTGYGDGCYPVYARYNSDGRVAEVRIIYT